MKQRPPRPFGTEHLLFFLSGVSALVLEVLWLRELGLLLGNTAYAASLTLSVFFLGLAIGGRAWGRRSTQFSHPLRAYALLEVGVAGSALLFLLIGKVYYVAYPVLFAALGDGVAFAAAKALLAGLALLPPAIFMGGTFPVMGQHLIRHADELGSTGSLLYGVNTIGGMVGVVLAGFFLPRLWGYGATYLAAVALAGSVAAAAVLVSFFRPSRPPARAASRTREEGGGRIDHRLETRSRLIYMVALLSGCVTLALELLWVRMFAQVLQNSVYSFAAILATFLAALGIGALAASFLARRAWGWESVLGWLLGLGGAAVAATPFVFYALTDGLTYLASDGGWSAYVLSVFALAAAVILLPGVLLGTVFPFLLKALEGSHEEAGPLIGRLVLANSVGAILGPLIAGFVLLGAVGVWSSIGLLAYGYLFLAAVLLVRSASRTRLLRLAPIAGLVLLALVFPPTRLSPLQLAPETRLGGVWHGTLGTVAVIQEEANLKLILDNHYTLGDTRSLGTERMQAHIPLLVHPDARSVFFLGLGTGITAGAALDHPVEKIVATEIVPEVIAAAREFFEPYVNGLFTDPRVRILTSDGRNRLLATEERYDVIVADLFTPWHSGAGSLYSVDHFRTVRSRLADDGVFAQWLALYQLSLEEFLIISRSLAEVFPQVTVWRANFSTDRPVVALLATKQDRPLDAEAFRRHVGRLFSEAGGEPEDRAALGGLFYAGNLTALRDLLRSHPVNTDDRPVIEFLAPIQQRRNLAYQVPRLIGPRLAELYERLFAGLPPEADPYLEALGTGVRDAVRAGLAYYRSKLFEASGNLDLAAEYRGEFEARMPPELVGRIAEWTARP